MYLVRNRKLMNFRNNKTFLKLLDPALVIPVKKYMHENRIRVNKAADPALEDLIYYCNSR